MRGIELADELIEPEGSLPDFQEQAAAGAAAADAALPIDGGIVGLMPSATARELARSNLQTIYTSTELGYRAATVRERRLVYQADARPSNFRSLTVAAR